MKSAAWRDWLATSALGLALVLGSLSAPSCASGSRAVAFPPSVACTATPAPAPPEDDDDPPDQGPVDVTFIAQSDAHLGSDLGARWLGRPLGPPVSLAEIDRLHRHVAEQANTMQGRPWPAALGGTVGRPLGMVIAGDLTEGGDASEWTAFERVYAPDSAGTLKMPVAESIGNHDRHGAYVAEQVTRRHGSVAYSVDWGSLHVVSLGEEPEEDTVQWLAKDLDCVETPRPIVIFFHKPVAGPHSASGWLASANHAGQFLGAIHGHDVVAILHGHVHRTGPYQWNGIPVYVLGSAKNEARSFLVVHVTDDRLQVASWNYEFGAFWWWEQRPRHGASHVPRLVGKRSFDTRAPLVPYPADPFAEW